MSDIVKRARHEWANTRPISPDLVVSLIAELERLRAELNQVREILNNREDKITRLQIIFHQWPWLSWIWATCIALGLVLALLKL